MPADARREPLPDAGHGPGRPPDGPPGEEPWGFARGFRSLFQWPQQNAAPPLPPLTASGLRGLHEDGDQDGGVHRPAATSSGPSRSNGAVRRKEAVSQAQTPYASTLASELIFWQGAGRY